MYMYRSMHQWGPEPQKSTLTGGPGYQGQRQLQPTTLPPAQMGGVPMGTTGVPMGTTGVPMGNWPTPGTYGGTYFPAQQQQNNPFGGSMVTTDNTHYLLISHYSLVT